MKNMFHVFLVLPPDSSRNFSKSQSLKFLQVPRTLHKKEAIYDDSHLASLSAFKSRSLYGESSEFFQSQGLYIGRGTERGEERFPRSTRFFVLLGPRAFI